MRLRGGQMKTCAKLNLLGLQVLGATISKEKGKMKRDDKNIFHTINILF